MSNVLCVTVRFLAPDPEVHGTRDGGQCEWPPSPLRLFQALVDGAASLWRGNNFNEQAKPALEWLQRVCPSFILAPRCKTGLPFRIAVPNNDLDSPARVWAKGGEPAKPHRPIDLKTMKTVCPVRVICNSHEEGPLRYVYPLSDEECPYIDQLTQAARSITHLGWGIDMAVGDAAVITSEQAAQLPGHRWQPSPVGGTPLRTPTIGTLDDLTRRHTDFLNRLTPDGFRPVPPLRVFETVQYRRDDDPAPRPFVVFDILRPQGTDLQSFDTVRRATTVSGMVRHALAECAMQQRPFGWTSSDIATIVQGHAPGEHGGAARLDLHAPRFAYLPLPSIERRSNGNRRATGIRRVMIAGRPGMESAIAWAERALAGVDLVEEHTGIVRGTLSVAPANNYVQRQYTRPAATWTTITPVVLPGYDDRASGKTAKLLRKAFMQAGYPAELVSNAELDWRHVGFFAGVDLASRYRRPANASQAPVVHVKARWRDENKQPIDVPGPLAIGSGRFRGLGLFVACEES